MKKAEFKNLYGIARLTGRAVLIKHQGRYYSAGRGHTDQVSSAGNFNHPRRSHAIALESVAWFRMHAHGQLSGAFECLKIAKGFRIGESAQ